MITKNEIVVYGTTGICQIIGIENKEFSAGETISYYVLKPIYTANTVFYVPVNNEQLVEKMHHVLTKQEIDTLLEEIRDDHIAWIDDDQARSAAYGAIIARGIRAELLVLIKCLYTHRIELRNSGKKFHAADEKLLVAAEKLVSEEFAYVLGIDIDQVPDYIAGKIESEEAVS